MTLPFANSIPTPSRPVHIHTIQDVWDWIVSHAKDPAQPKKDNPHGFRLQYLTKLQSHCSGAPFATIFAGADLLVEFDQNFPKVKKGVHPRGDLPQDIETYKKWRQGARKAIEMAIGATAEKVELRSRQDGWTELLSAIKLHCTDGGVIQNPKRAIPVTKLAEVARRARIEPWELAIDGTLEHLKGAFAVPDDREHLRRAQRFLNDYSFLPELAAVLPEIPASVFSDTASAHGLTYAHRGVLGTTGRSCRDGARRGVRQGQPVRERWDEEGLAISSTPPPTIFIAVSS